MSPKPSTNQTQTKNEPVARTGRATQLPDDFRPTDHHRALVAELRIANPGAELAKFKDHYRATGRTMKDWNAAFNNWLRKAAEQTNVRRLPVATTPPPDDWRRLTGPVQR